MSLKHTFKIQGFCFSIKSYFEEAKWIGSGSDDCSNPAKLYDYIVGHPSMLYEKIDIGNFIVENVTFLDLSETPEGELAFGRCYMANIPKGVFNSQVTIYGQPDIELDIRFHTPGNWYDDDYKFIRLDPYRNDDVDVNNEIFEVLDYGEEECKNYDLDYKRDDCITNYIESEALTKIGCTTPFIGNSSNICTDQKKAKDALKLYLKIRDQSINNELTQCPKPCKFYMIDFGRSSTTQKNESSENIEEKRSQLTIKFRKYIKHSKVKYTYQGLEMFAEVGGYLGLLLGMSLNQLPSLISSMTEKLYKTD